jgi:hypothetical protein
MARAGVPAIGIALPSPFGTSLPSRSVESPIEHMCINVEYILL